MENFSVLSVHDGVGDWHFNRFRVAFKPPPQANEKFLGSEFAANFPKYVTSKYATAQQGGRTFLNMPTFHFHGYKFVPYPDPTFGDLDIDIAAPHSDWVVKIDDNDGLGFSVQTIKREFEDPSEDRPTLAAKAGSVLLSPLGSFLFMRGENDPTQVNRMHFLAGRRSWRIDDGKNFEVDGDVMVLETSAIERFSHDRYKQADAVLKMEDALPDIWCSMCENYVKMNALVRVPQRLRPGWKNKYGADYYVRSYSNFEGLAGDAEFAQQKRLGLFKTLLPAR